MSLISLQDSGTSIQATWTGAIANVFLAVIKILAGVFGNSAAMIADAVHSISDIGSDAVVMVGLRISDKPIDESHPYGHGKVETSAALFVGALVSVAGLGIFYHGFVSLYQGRLTDPGPIAIVAAAISIAIKEILYQYTIRIGRREKKPSVIANAWHHRSDALSSVAVLIGVGGNMAGVPYLDQIAAIVVSVFVVRAGILIAWEAYKDLVDTAVDYRLRNRIIQIIESTDGVQGWHRLRTRKVGAAVFVDMHIAVADELSIREAHKIADRVDHTLTDKLDIDDVIVHIEPQSVCRESEHDKS